MNVVLMLAHNVEEHDQLRLLHGLGYDVFSIGGYSDPAHPAEPYRPALPELPVHHDLIAACERKREEHAGESTTVRLADGGMADVIDWAKFDLPQEVLDWADVLMVHHFEHTWLAGGQWPRLREWMQGGKRVIWRTVGQSVENNERMMRPLRDTGLERVAYSPKEANIPGYSGHDALIRFYADPDEWTGWTGDRAHVINVTQHLRQREPFTNWRFWELVTKGLPRTAMGPGSDKDARGNPDPDGTGPLSFDRMQEALRRARAYLYTGTQPASYTLGLIEAGMTGVPIVSIGPGWHGIFPYGPSLFEGHELALLSSDDETVARGLVMDLLNDASYAGKVSRMQRARFVDLFGMDRIGAQWVQYLSGVPATLELVAA